MGRFDDEDPRDPDREYDARRSGDKGPIQPTPVRNPMHFMRDGNVRAITWDDIQPGHVLRETSQERIGFGSHPVGMGDYPKFQSVHPTFSDAIIVDVYPDDKGNTQVLLARPYLYATGVGTTAKRWLMGVEEITVYGSRLIGDDSIYRIVLLASGAPQKMAR